MIGGVSYDKIDEQGLHYTKDTKGHVLNVDHIVICAGQESVSELSKSLDKNKISNSLIGGAFKAGELDAKYAIAQGYKLGIDI